MTKLIGKKLRMTQVYENEKITPVTEVSFDIKTDLSKLEPGKLLKVVGITKSKGFQGVVKRHNFKGAPKSHGTKDQLRTPGSIGATTPSRVIKGHKMPGRMGGNRKTVKGLKLIKVDNDKKEILIKGALPGNNKGKVEIVASKR